MTSFPSSTYNDCHGLAVDAQNFYTICQIGSSSNYAALRIDRTTGALTELIGTMPGNTTAGQLHMHDSDADGTANFLYLRTNRRETYFICQPATATPYFATHVSFGASTTTSYGLGFDPVANVLWAYDDTAHELVKIE